MGVVNELCAPGFPHSKEMFLVVAWQRGLGTFQFYWQLSDEDGAALLRSEPVSVVMDPVGNELTLPYALTVRAPGLYLVEGFVDGEITFKTTFRVSSRD